MKKPTMVYPEILYYFITALMLFLGTAYEKPYGNRKYLLLGLLLFYFLTHIGFQFFKRSKLILIFGLCSILILTIIEVNSKYAINYFFHSVFLLLMMYIIFYTSHYMSIVLTILLSVAATLKFAELLWIQPNQANLSVSVFFIIIQLLVLLVFYFIKTTKKENNKNRDLYEELLETHRKLKIYSGELKQLTTLEERAKIARDLHDTLGHELTGLIMQMEMASRFFEADQFTQGERMLEDAKSSARGSLSRVRHIVNTLKNDQELQWSSSTIQALADDFSRKTGTEIQCDIRSEIGIHPDIGIALYRVIQEALTNAIRHGKATGIQIEVIYREDALEFSVKDNGKGCKVMIPGNGLTGMQERLAEVGGLVRFNGQFGFTVSGVIPYQKDEGSPDRLGGDYD